MQPAKAAPHDGRDTASTSHPRRPLKSLISFYLHPPADEIRVDQFTEFGHDRLRVLRRIEESRVRGLKKEEFDNDLEKVTSRDLPLLRSSDIQKDVISHFILLLAFCSPSERRSWFVEQECELLRFRMKPGRCDISSFLEENNVVEQRLSVEEYHTVRTHLETLLSPQEKLGSQSHLSFYKVDFRKVLDLVLKRKVYLQDGMAYVHVNDLISVALHMFRQHLESQLEMANRGRSSWERDSRVKYIVSNIPDSHGQGLHPSFDFHPGHMDPLQIDWLSKNAFPLCAQNLHRNLTKNHHLKHWARCQYGLFLRAAGLDYEAAMAFWKREFCRDGKTDAQTFDKQYSYIFRYLYEKEGRGCAWSPFSCKKAITTFTILGEGEHQGCPYQTFDTEHLRASLEKTMREQSKPFSPEDWTDITKSIDEIIELAVEGHYQVKLLLSPFSQDSVSFVFFSYPTFLFFPFNST